MIPVLLKVLGNIDIEEEGISIVPIHGVHFSCFMRLFGPEAIRKKCAVITDGDLRPSDSDDEGDGAEDDREVSFPRVDQLRLLENGFVQVFSCDTTFERELAVPNLPMFVKAARELGAPRIANSLEDIYERQAKLEEGEEEEARDKVLRTARRFGKARFAQVCARYTEDARVIPKYILDAVTWLRL